MLPIEKITFVKEEVSDVVTVIYGKFKHVQSAAINPEVQNPDEQEDLVKRSMQQLFWWDVYGDLRQPLSELMLLARLCAESNPARYSEAARIGELTEELNELMDWRKQLAAKQEEEKK